MLIVQKLKTCQGKYPGIQYKTQIPMKQEDNFQIQEL